MFRDYVERGERFAAAARALAGSAPVADRRASAARTNAVRTAADGRPRRARRTARRRRRAPGPASTGPQRALRLVPPPRVRRDAAGARLSVTLLLAPALLLTAIGLVMVLSASSVTAYEEYGSSFLFFNRQVIYARCRRRSASSSSTRMPHRHGEGLSLPCCSRGRAAAAGAAPGDRRRVTAARPVARHRTGVPAALRARPSSRWSSFTATDPVGKWRRLDELRSRWSADPAGAGGGGRHPDLLQRDLGTDHDPCGDRVPDCSSSPGSGCARCVIDGLGGTAGRDRADLRRGVPPGALLLLPASVGRPAAAPATSSSSAHRARVRRMVRRRARRQPAEVDVRARTPTRTSSSRSSARSSGWSASSSCSALFGRLITRASASPCGRPTRSAGCWRPASRAWLGLQAVVNLGAVTGLMPITGVPLPFVSFGGSSLVVTLAAVGRRAGEHRPGGRGGGSGRPRARRKALADEVVIAGGGTAATSSRPSPSRRSSRPADTTSCSSAPRTGSRPGSCPRRAFDFHAVRGRAARAPRVGGDARGAVRRRSAPCARAGRSCRRRAVVGMGGYVSVAVGAGRRAGSTSGRAARAERRAGSREPAARPGGRRGRAVLRRRGARLPRRAPHRRHRQPGARARSWRCRRTGTRCARRRSRRSTSKTDARPSWCSAGATARCTSTGPRSPALIALLRTGAISSCSLAHRPRATSRSCAARRSRSMALRVRPAAVPRPHGARVRRRRPRRRARGRDQHRGGDGRAASRRC